MRTIGFITLAAVLLMGAAIAEPTAPVVTASQGAESLVSSILTGGGTGAVILVFLWRQMEQLRAQVSALAAQVAGVSTAVERLERFGCDHRCDSPLPREAPKS